MTISKLLTVLLVLITTASMGQSADSLIIAEGKIVNKSTKEPIHALISYHNTPTGNHSGTLHHSSYNFEMRDRAKYTVTVEANGYLPAKYLFDPSEATNGRYVKDIELAPGTPPNTHVPGHVMRLSNLIFVDRQSHISPESYGELELVLNMLNSNPKMVIQLEGHTDYQGNANENMKLSESRVASVRKYLMGKGIHSNRIKTKAFGGTMPISKDGTPHAHSLNRRIELRILSN